MEAGEKPALPRNCMRNEIPEEGHLMFEPIREGRESRNFQPQVRIHAPRIVNTISPRGEKEVIL